MILTPKRSIRRWILQFEAPKAYGWVCLEFLILSFSLCSPVRQEQANSSKRNVCPSTPEVNKNGIRVSHSDTQKFFHLKRFTSNALEYTIKQTYTQIYIKLTNGQFSIKNLKFHLKNTQNKQVKVYISKCYIH